MVAFMPTNSIAVDGTPAAAGGSGSTPVRQLKIAASSSQLRNSHLSYILSVAFSTDGRRFATVSADRCVSLGGGVLGRLFFSCAHGLIFI